MRKILSFKPWQIFLLLVIPAIWSSPSPLQEIISCISVATLTIWIYAIGTYGQEKIQAIGLKPSKMILFKVNTSSIPILYIILLLLSPSENYPEPITFNIRSLIQLITALYFSYAIIQTSLFAAKTIMTIEKRKEIFFKNYNLYFFLLIINLIGVWILQPKVTKLIADDNK